MRKALSFLAIVVAALALPACKRGAPGSGTSASTTEAAMTKGFVSTNGLITARFPADFAGSTAGTSSIVVTRDLPGGVDEALSFVPIENPISNDLKEFARIVGAAEVGGLNGYVETSALPASCVGKPGIETTGTWRSVRGSVTYLRKACHFLDRGHGYSISYSVPTTLAEAEEPTLRAIREATQFNR